MLEYSEQTLREKGVMLVSVQFAHCLTVALGWWELGGERETLLSLANDPNSCIVCALNWAD